MPLSYSYPGIYIQEVPSSSHAITPAPTSIAAFVGYSHPFKTTAFNVAQQLFSFNDYQTYFGPLFSSGLVDGSLARAVYQFFLNGGSSAWAVGLQPGMFDANGDIINRIGGVGGATITAGTVGLSASTAFAVNPANTPPSIASLAPASLTEGGSAFTLTVTGANFVPGCKVLWNGTDLGTTSFVDAATLTAVVPAAQIAAGAASPVPVTVSNPAAGTTSAAANLTLNAANLVPTIMKLSPAEAPAGGLAFTMTVTGANFVGASVVDWNGTPLSTAFVSDTTLTAAVTAADIAAAGAVNVTVSNPIAGPSTADTFTIGSATPTPTLSSIAPASATAGGGAFTLTVTGADFVTGATVNWNGAPLTTALVSATELTAHVLAANAATAQPVSITVVNPAPGGASAGSLPFTINSANLTPTVSGLAPTSAPVNGVGFTLTVTGANFTPGSIVNWGGVPLPTTFVSDTELTVAVPAADLGTAGTVSIMVSNPTNTGLVFTARELSDQTPMTVTIANVRSGGATFDLVVTYGNQVETYRNLQLVGAQSPDKKINGVSQLITVAAAAAGYGTGVTAQQLTLSLKLPSNFSTCFSADDFLEAQAPNIAVFDTNSSLDNLEIFNLLLTPGVSDFAVLNAALAFAERKRAFMIVDLPQQAPAFGSATAAPQPVEAWMEGLGGPGGPSLPTS